MAETRRSPAELSAADRMLIEVLARDGRATYEALAQALGVSRPAVRARLARLLESGAVRIAGVVHPEVFGLTAYAHAGLTLDGPARPVAARLASLRDAPFVSAVAGPFDLIAELRAPDQDALAAAIRQVSALPHVRQVETAVYTAILKNGHFPSRAHPAASVDDADRRLLAQLQRDGRASFAELGAAVGLSLSAARTRVLRLLDTGAVHIGAQIHPQTAGAAQHLGFEVALGEDAAKAVEAITGHPSVQYFATAIGRCDGVGTAVANTPDEILGFLDELRETPGIRRVTSWSHLHVFKEAYDRIERSYGCLEHRADHRAGKPEASPRASG